MFTASEGTIFLARKWLHDCLAQHSACAVGRQSAVGDKKLPTRLIDIGQDPSGTQKPCLVTTTHLSANTGYFTLSHSWGDGRFLRLTSTNLAELQSSIPEASMSKSHTDALSITRRLGYRYIWIDSLCIIQDSTDDWRSQSAQMASIYGNSTCNIAAEGHSGRTGCFVRRNPLMHRPCHLTPHAVYAHPYHTVNWSDFAEHYYSNVPLLGRAWVQQERILSPRMLYFGGPEIHWECCSFQASEAWPYGPPSQDHGFDEVYPLKAAFEAVTKPFGEWDRDDFSLFVYEMWHNGVFRKYTAAALTFEKDRLVAFAGIAEVVQRRTGMTYLAGLWKEFLPMDLLWYTVDEPAPGQKHLDPLPWKAPTWSWASVVGRKIYHLHSLHHPKDDEGILYLSRVVDCMMTPLDGETPVLGEVAGGVISLTGFLTPMPRIEPGGQTRRISWASRHSGRRDRIYMLDVDVSESSELWYLMLMKTRDNENSCTDRGFLVTKPAQNEDNSYIRVGFFLTSYETTSGGMFGGSDEVTIRLI